MGTLLTANVALVSETDLVALDQLAIAAAAMQNQVTTDFGPLWNIAATVSAFDSLDSVPVDYWPVVIRDDINAPGAAGYHTDNNGQPFSLVQADAGWELTASHEALEMLVDPFGSRTISGAPPPQAPQQIQDMQLVNYLVEVCDPCEAITYSVNGQLLTDFITPNYYDPTTTSGVRYSFSGQISAPHTVQEGGYISFGNPVDNHWYQILVQGGQVQLNDLGVVQASGGASLKELLDGKIRDLRSEERYRLKSATRGKARAMAPFAEKRAARASQLRALINSLQ